MNNKGVNQVTYTGTAPLSSPSLFPDLMTEQELITFLRIPEVSAASNHNNVIKNLIRMRDLPRIHICNKLLFPRQAILEWMNKETIPKTSLTDNRASDISTSPKKRAKIKIHR